ncbi:amidohydrolase family protein [Geobacter pelophilus]|uniref:Amidohydrolase family protein n=1 Tax=Geoanaerobacter pelophilus TaxID=60036 RepID=A0AAW4L3W5_9BACT|nr:amidohydrolase family protein [Geoanaerobacter pelophilus]MBT0665869.1 amidohydrolase family protein [Geoanaerobacter pelophilus]
MKIIAASYLYNPGSAPVVGGAVAVRDGQIIAVGTLDQLRGEFPWPVEDHPGCVLMPGMVNAHTHLELTHFPSWKIRKGLDYMPRQYVDWIVQVVKISRGLSSEELLHSLVEGARISLAAGTTTVGDILSSLTHLPDYLKLPVAGRVYLEAIGHDPVKCEERRAEIAAAIESFSGDALVPGVSPHTPHTLSEQFMRDMTGFAHSSGLPTMIHLAESSDEIDFWFDATGRIAEDIFTMAGWAAYLPPPRRMSPVAYLDALGVLTPMTTCVHCVHVTPGDVGILRDRGVSVVICPRSNDRLVVGTPPLMLFRGSRIPLAIGTDSLASNDSLSLWDEIRFLHERYPRMFTAEELLEMATIGGAKVLHLDGRAGTLEQGKRADIQILATPASMAAQTIADTLLEAAVVSKVYLAGVDFNP